jgi:transcriptional regulator with GAF, ATPase, and Fis domain
MSADLNPEHRLSQAISQLSGILFSETSPEDTLRRVAEAAQRVVPGCAAASVTLVEKGRPGTPASTSPAAFEVDVAQYESNEGPCLEAVRTRESVSIQSLSESRAFPEFSVAAIRHGFRSSLSLPLRVAEETVGALNLYGEKTGAFEASESVGAVFARQAAITVANARAIHRASDLATQLAEALEHRDMIGQAKGIVMAQSSVSSDEAFDVLRRASQRVNRKLYDIAREVVERHQSPRPEGAD